mgnify:CR=1 FL=1
MHLSHWETSGQFFVFLFVAGWLERKPYDTTKRHGRRLEFRVAVVAIVVPGHGDVREPQKEHEYPAILGRQKPVATGQGRREQDTLDVKLEGPAREHSSGHSYYR